MESVTATSGSVKDDRSVIRGGNKSVSSFTSSHQSIIGTTDVKHGMSISVKRNGGNSKCNGHDPKHISSGAKYMIREAKRSDSEAKRSGSSSASSSHTHGHRSGSARGDGSTGASETKSASGSGRVSRSLSDGHNGTPASSDENHRQRYTRMKHVSNTQERSATHVKLEGTPRQANEHGMPASHLRSGCVDETEDVQTIPANASTPIIGNKNVNAQAANSRNESLHAGCADRGGFHSSWACTTDCNE